jgi:hypothetical protein
VEAAVSFTSKAISHLQMTGRVPASKQAEQPQQKQVESQHTDGSKLTLATVQALSMLTKRRRPFIYVYDLPPAYNARMLQYRVEK